MKMAGDGMALFVAEISKIGPGTMFLLALSMYALGGALVAAGIGATIAIIPLALITGPLLGIAFAALTVAFAVNLLAAGFCMITECLGAFMKMMSEGGGSFAAMVPIVTAFSVALMGIGAAAIGILATAAALLVLAPAIAGFGIATKVIGLKKLEALTEFNKSATLTVDTVYKPDTNKAGRNATEERMEGAAAGKSMSTAAPGSVSKPVINFNKHSVLVKIGERELHDVVMEVLKGPEFAKEIGLR
jgi:hypothetical protein